MRPTHIAALHEAYASGGVRPADVIRAIYEEPLTGPVFISVVPVEEALAMAASLEQRDPAKLPLYGIPFAVKDNIDLAGLPTTAGCPDYAYTPEASATCVAKLIGAGAIPIGKTNLDQFATGLVGTRSPYGACSSVFSEEHISGGSSSGSAVAVARGLVTFALGTDTAGSGRIPAAFNNIVGLKPTRGRVSTAGVVPACRTLDCVSVFAMTSADAQRVLGVLEGADAADPYSRAPRAGEGAAPWLGGAFRFGVPRPDQLEFFGDGEAPGLFEAAARKLTELGGTCIEIDFSPFREAAQLLYSGPWVAERYAAVGDFLSSPHTDPTVASIIRNAAKLTGVDAFRGMYRLEALRAATAPTWNDIDLLLLPTAPRTYTIDEVRNDPVRLNSNLGYYTNFVNLLDLAAVAVSAGFGASGLPFGVSLIGPAFTDEALLATADRLHRALVDHLEAPQIQTAVTPPGCTAVAVVGAHLTGQPLNWQLTSRGGRLVRTCRTSPEYRLYALSGTMPPKPGLVREPGFHGPGIEVEVWAVPSDRFGSFVGEIPPPLGIGTVTLDDGAQVKCFLCEPYAIAEASEITALGGWRNYLASRTSTVAR